MKNLSANRFRRIKILLIFVFMSGHGLLILNQILPNFSPMSAYAQSADKFDSDFDTLVRNDFFAGMTGNEERLERAMKNAEAVLAKNPKHAQALVWHGGGQLARASLAYRKGDTKRGDKLWQQGLKEMDEALSYAPDRIDVIIGRSATIIGLAQSGFNSLDKESRALLESALLGYEQVYQKQKPHFSQISEHSRGELLFGLASGWSILGEYKKAQFYLRLISKEVKDSTYEKEARKWSGSKQQIIEHNCRGCHISY